jgi:hypothetical protein
VFLYGDSTLTVCVLVQREDEGEIRLKGRYRPSGGDFQGMRVYRSDVSFLELIFMGGAALAPPLPVIVPMSPSGYPSAGCVPAEPASVSPDTQLFG